LSQGVVKTFLNVSDLSDKSLLPYLLLPHYKDYSILFALLNLRFNYTPGDFITPSNAKFCMAFVSGKQKKNLLISDTTYIRSASEIVFPEATGKRFGAIVQGNPLNKNQINLWDGFPSRENLELEVPKDTVLSIASCYLDNTTVQPHQYQEYYLALCANPVLIITKENAVRQKEAKEFYPPNASSELDDTLKEKSEILTSVGVGNIKDIYRKPILVDSSTNLVSNINHFIHTDFPCLVFEGISEYSSLVAKIKEIENIAEREAASAKLFSTPKVVLLSWRSNQDIAYATDNLFDSGVRQNHNLPFHNRKENGVWIYVEDRAPLTVSVAEDGTLEEEDEDEL
jgi:hypothetical protein